MAEQSIRHGTSETFFLARPDHPRTTQGSLRSQLLSQLKILYKVLTEQQSFHLFSKPYHLGLLSRHYDIALLMGANAVPSV